ncbi:mutator type transposase [Tanacetum coccineum]
MLRETLNLIVQQESSEEFMCVLGALKSGFKAGQRDLLGLDGCFMSGPFPMHIITAVGVDPNNGIYPLAYAVVESETKQSWLWFLDCLGDDLELFRNSNFTFVTDKQKGVIPALAEIFLVAEHIYCLKHIYDNLKVMEEVKQANKDVYDWLKDIPPQHWARSYFSARPHCDVLLNNMCEVLSRQLLDERDKPIITCLEFIREYLMKWIVIVQQNGGILYQATDQYRDQCVVNVEERGCSYRKFKINPCNGPDLWSSSDSPIILTPPDYHTPIGRPPKKRKKSAAELYDGMVKDGKLSMAGKTFTCTKCGQKGHNSRSCKGQRGGQSTRTPMPNQGPSQSTQIPSQGIVNPSTPTVNVNLSAQHNMTHYAPHVTVNPSAQSNVTQSTPPLRYSKATTNMLSPAKKTNSSGKRKVGE